MRTTNHTPLPPIYELYSAERRWHSPHFAFLPAQTALHNFYPWSFLPRAYQISFLMGNYGVAPDLFLPSFPLFLIYLPIPPRSEDILLPSTPEANEQNPPAAK